MSKLLTVVKLPRISGLPRDAVENTFSWNTNTTPPSAAELLEIDTLITAFYNTAHAPSLALCTWISDVISRTANAVSITHYDVTAHLDGSPHGSPLHVANFTLGAPGAGAASLPAELAVCLSLKADYGVDVEFGVGARPRARDRGRVYIGPLTTGALATAAGGGEQFVDVSVRDSVAKAGDHLSEDGAAVQLMVWSRKNAAMHFVVDGWVDNAFDVQRRRGNAATVRETLASV